MKCLILLALVGLSLCAESTTVAPSSTTSTEPSSTSSTTENPTTSTPAPDPTPAPIPPEAKSDSLHFEINSADGNGSVCALFEFVAKIEFRYPNATLHGDPIYLNNNTSLNSLSSCNVNTTNLVLNINNNTESRLSLQLNHTVPIYTLDRIEATIPAGPPHKESFYKLISNGTLISKIDDTKSYTCDSQTQYDLSIVDQKTNITAVLILSGLKIDAFRSKDAGKNFRTTEQCEADFPSNDFVPLAVGCALIALVLIVLIAYIVGRKRSHRLTYQSV